MKNMRQVDVRIQLELIDEDPFNAEWIEQAVEEILFLDQGERITKFESSSPSCPVVDNWPTTQHDESDEIELGKTYTVTSSTPRRKF